MKIVEFVPKANQANPNPTLERALAVLDLLREEVAAGRVEAFAAASLTEDDSVFMYTGSIRPVTRLRITGAISTMLHSYQQNSCEG